MIIRMLTPLEKDKSISTTQINLANAREILQKETQYLNDQYLQNILKTLSKSGLDEAIGSKVTIAIERNNQLKDLMEVPYFTELTARNPDGTTRPIRIAKFSCTDANIYSWTAPIGSLRFEEPGKYEYQIHTGDMRTVDVIEKDELMIRNQELVYLARTSLDCIKEVLLKKEVQEHKLAFAMSDIVDRMEGYQDKIIRLPYFGKMIITGPAGSGKTTLALHRIAYLKLIPLYEKIFKRGNSLVVVKDESSKQYFQELLPNLGIKGNTVETYASLGRRLLQIPESIHIVHNPESEYVKSKIVSQAVISKTKSLFTILAEVYKEYPDVVQCLAQQKKQNVLDYTDIAHLLHQEAYKKQGIFVTKKFSTFKGGREIASASSMKVTYNIILIDEFQNYSQLELRSLDALIDSQTESIMYVGDTHQTIYKKGVGLNNEYKTMIKEERHIHVAVSYRNTREIIKYISERGHDTLGATPKRSGESVTETVSAQDEMVQGIEEFIKSRTTGVNAVIASQSMARLIQDKIIETETCKIFSYEDCQGFEFESTLVVLESNIPENEIHKNLEYIALTRAMNEMKIIKI